MDNNQYFTPEGLEKLKEEFKNRTEVLRGDIAKRLKEAKEEGDISENAGFDAAKESQAVNEGRIEEIKVTLENATESDPQKGFISNESPLGDALLGKKKGDKIKVRTPKGEVEYRILEVK